MLNFTLFVECQTTDGYGNTFWQEICQETGFLDGYYNAYNWFITEELFIGLSNIKDGYFAPLFKMKPPADLSVTVRYKLDMLSCLGDNKIYCLSLNDINNFDWTRQIYASFLTTPTTFADVAPDFMNYVVPNLNVFGPPNKVRVIILKKG